MSRLVDCLMTIYECLNYECWNYELKMGFDNEIIQLWQREVEVNHQSTEHFCDFIMRGMQCAVSLFDDQ